MSSKNFEYKYNVYDFVTFSWFFEDSWDNLDTISIMMQYKCNMWWNVRQQDDIVTSLQTFVRGNYFWSLLEKTQYSAKYPYSSLSNFNVFRWGDVQRASVGSRKATVCAVYLHLRASFVTVLQLYLMKIVISWYGNIHP